MSTLKEFREILGIEGDVIDRDYAPIVVGERTKETIMQNPARYTDARIAAGLFYTDAEKEAELERLRRIRLP